MDWLIGIASGLALTWLLLIGALFVVRPRGVSPGEALRLLPDTLRLLRRLAADRELPRGERRRLAAVLVYLALPFDLIPDFLPVIGHLDDVIVVLWALRGLVRRAGREVVRRHWPGSDDGLAALCRLAGI